MGMGIPSSHITTQPTLPSFRFGITVFIGAGNFPFIKHRVCHGAQGTKNVRICGKSPTHELPWFQPSRAASCKMTKSPAPT